MVTVNGVPIDG